MAMIDRSADVRPIKVLVVDDDHRALTSLEGLLSTEFDVQASASPLVALELARAESRRGAPFDVVCSDFRMDEMDGVELLKQITRLPDSTSCVLITGYIEVLAGEHRRAEHILGIVVKPYEPDHIVSLVGRLGRVSRMNRSIRELSSRSAARRF